MSNLPVDVVNRIMRFVSHPTADMIKPTIISTKIRNCIEFRSRIVWLFHGLKVMMMIMRLMYLVVISAIVIM